MSCHSLFFLRQITNLALYTCSCRSIWKILRTFLYVSKSYRIHQNHMINCYSLIIASFIAFFSSSWVIFCTHGGLHPSRWIYRSLKLFIPSWCLWPWELQIHVYWIVITCSLEQVSSFFSCRRLYRTFPTIQIHQLHGENYFIKHMHNDKILCIMQLFSQYNIHPYLTETF